VRLFTHPLPYWNYIVAAAAGFLILYLLAVVSRGGMGGGDIKLYLFIGLVGGISTTLLSLFIASVLGTVYGIASRYNGHLKPRQPIPFGPFIAIAAFLSFLYGDRWIHAYLNLWLH
jgi:leader peptidase (prepilin peptidase)/N-methyltransferase